MMNTFRYLPAIDQLKRDSVFTNLLKTEAISDKVLTDWLREQVDIVRTELHDHIIPEEKISRKALNDRIFNRLTEKVRLFQTNNLQPVINATGVVLHTNLGRARLSANAIAHISSTAASYSTLEYDVQTGERGSRHDLVEEHLTRLTGAEAAMVVNNNAAAVYLVLKALAFEREVIVSRGELVEIGGSFRISEIMKESQATLVDVGTTNKTHVNDYADAITEETALLMKVHKSNFKMIGFTDEVNTEELVHLSTEHNIPIFEDLGSGTLFDFTAHKIGDEPTVQEKVAAGIDLISFSGDKLLGGPQAGVIIGKKEFIDILKKHQLARVLRVDKFTLAGLEATLKSYLREQEETEIPTIRDIVESEKTIHERAETFIQQMNEQEADFNFDIQEDTSKIGGGTMPEVEMDTYVVHVTHGKYTSSQIAETLRKKEIPIIARVQHDKVLLDFRTIDDEDMHTLVSAFL